MNNVENSIVRDGNKLYINLWGLQKTVYIKYPLSIDSTETKKRLSEQPQVEVWSGDYEKRYLVDGNNPNHVIYVKF